MSRWIRISRHSRRQWSWRRPGENRPSRIEQRLWHREYLWSGRRQCVNPEWSQERASSFAGQHVCLQDGVKFTGCYHYILNIALRNAMCDAFGQHGGMTSFILFRLLFRVGYLPQQNSSYYKDLYMSEKILPRAPPLLQQFVETRRTYSPNAEMVDEVWQGMYSAGPPCFGVHSKERKTLPR